MMDAATQDLLEAWAFNVMLECSALDPDGGQCAIGGAVLSLHDLNTVLQAALTQTKDTTNARV